MGVTISGTFSGLDVNSIINAVIAADSIPITNLQTTNTNIANETSDLGSLESSLNNLSTSLQTLSSNTLFQSQTATLSNTAVGTATVNGSAASGVVSVNVQQVATNTVLTSGSATGGTYTDTKLTAPPAGTETVASLLNESNIAGQTFTINGKQITLAQTDVIDDGNPDSTNSLIGKINNSGAGVTASYNSTTGAFSIISNTSSPIILGSATDTSDFLQQAQLFNNGSTSVTSQIGIGRVDPTADLATAGLRTTPTTGTFSINGVTLNYNSGDTLNSLINTINSSSAGVTASYDSYEDQIVLTSNTRGPQNITVADGTSNIATALRLTSTDSTVQEGKPTLFTVGNSTTVRQSDSSTLSSTDLGIAGLSLNVTGTGTSQITVAPDTTTIANAINSFIDQYNSTQNVISSYLKVDPSDPTQNGSLASENALTFLPVDLRSTMTSAINQSSTINMLATLGINSNSTDNTLTHVDNTDLQNALTNNLPQVEALFNNATNGLTNSVQNLINGYSDPTSGVVASITNNLQQETTNNDNLINQMQENITAETTRLQNEFALLDSTEQNNQSISAILNNGTATSQSIPSVGGISSTGTSSSGSTAATPASSSTSTSSSGG